ncbi:MULTISPECIES: zinc-binding dehydrogenase [unclassified Schlesneria]|uniref:zinc-binding dehydrogenase n=2 Tax=Planctomycetaceae TaxID=126 RepID=UPI00359F1A3C
MKTPAAILVELSQPLELVDLEIPALKPGQALVEIAFSGVCHTQVLEARGRRGPDRFLPHCLGHEGSGIVREVGANVTRVQPGDHVVLSWIKGSGGDVPGTKYQWNGKEVNAGGITTFSRYSVISENRLTKLDQGLPFDLAALLGCAIPTGAGMVFNTANVRTGQSVAIFGVGGIGLSALAAASASGATPLIAIDRLPSKLDLARELGASHTICVTETNPVESIMAISPGGVDIAIEATGRAAVMQQALESVRAQGGAAIVAGNAPQGESWQLDPRQLNQGKRIIGTWGGDNVPDRDFPRYQRLLLAGKLPLQSLLARQYPLSGINDALNDLEAGLVPRPLIDLSRI